MNQHEYYFNIRQNIKEVANFIMDWIDSWKENAEDARYEFLDYNTDCKTKASLRIKTDGNRIDLFKIKVVKKEGKRKNITNISLDSWNEKVEE